MLKRSVWVFALICGLLFTGCSDESNDSFACESDASCGWGLVCVDGSCTKRECNAAGDCLSANQDCIIVESESVCSEVECGCASCEPCLDGMICEEGQCVLQTVSDTNDSTGDAPGDNCSLTPCGEGFTCNPETQICEADTGDDAPGDDCTVTPCEEGFTCNAETKMCEETPTVGAGEACASCTDDSECPTSWQCVAMGSGKFCLHPCSSDNDCDTGWSCQTGQGVCAPGGFKCEGCMISGCEGGQTCNTETGDCLDPKALCESCTYDWACGEGNACIADASGGKLCKPRCAGGTACDANASCEMDGDSGLEICGYTGSVCCYGADCAQSDDCTPACTGDTPVCFAGQCVGCASSSDCSDPTPICHQNGCVQCTGDGDCGTGAICNSATGQCESTQCAADEIYYNGQCVECLTNADCAAGTNCDTSTNTCGNNNGCDPGYPATVEIGGETYCVQCTEDAHCDTGCTCNLNSYACSGTCVVADAQCGDDAEDAVCDAGSTDFNLTCHESGLCVDDGGNCDNVTAYCPYGNDCISVLELLGGDGLGDFMGMMGGGSTGLPASCACETNDDCAASTECKEVDLAGALGGSPSGQGQFMCVDCSDILLMFLGVCGPSIPGFP